MKTFVKPLEELSGFSDIRKTIQKEKGLISVTGCMDAQKPHMIYALGQEKRNRVIVTFNEQRAKELYEELTNLDA